MSKIKAIKYQAPSGEWKYEFHLYEQVSDSHYKSVECISCESELDAIKTAKRKEKEMEYFSNSLTQIYP